MNPTPAQLAYIATMLFQLHLRMARTRQALDSLWMLQPVEAFRLMHALEQEKRHRGFPQLHLN
jgi:hypothetical protein